MVQPTIVAEPRVSGSHLLTKEDASITVVRHPTASSSPASFSVAISTSFTFIFIRTQIVGRCRKIPNKVTAYIGLLQRKQWVNIRVKIRKIHISVHKVECGDTHNMHIYDTAAMR